MFFIARFYSRLSVPARLLIFLPNFDSPRPFSLIIRYLALD